jgi:integrase
MAILKRQGKHKTTYLVYYRNPVTKKQEYRSFDDEFAAKKYDLEVKERIKKDPLSFTPPEPYATALNFKKLAEEYVLKHPLAESTLKTTHKTLEAEIFPYFSDIDVDAVSQKDLEDLVAAWQEKGNKPITVRRKLSYVSAILNWGYKTGRVKQRPPSYTIKVGKKKQPPTLTEEEISALYVHAGKHLKRAIILGTSLGMRIGKSELLNIKWQDVRWQDRTIIIYSAEKGGPSWREVDLTDNLYSVLQKWHEEDLTDLKYNPKYIINYRGKKIDSIKKAWAKAKKDAGIERRIRPYDLRHYFVTTTLAKGADLKAVSDIVGSDPRTLLNTYQHSVRRLKKEAVNKIDMPNFYNTEDSDSEDL